MLLADRIALVTGAGSGIGRAVSLHYAREGAMVILVGRRQRALEETHDRIVAAGGHCTIVPLDLDVELVRVPDLVNAVLERFQRLDILVNNAALLGNLTPLAALEPVWWEAIFRVNVTAPYFLTQSLLPLLRRSADGCVINVVSGLARRGRAYWGAYAMSKAALLNMTESWAEELAGSPVRINAVDPGPTATAIRAAAFPGEDPASLPTPEQVTPAFLYLASARGVNGQLLDARQWHDWRPPRH